MKEKTSHLPALALIVMGALLIFQSSLLSEDSPLLLDLHLCLWDEPESTAIQRISELNQKITPVPAEELSTYTNDILHYLLHINQDTAGNIKLYRTSDASPSREFLFFRHRLCCITSTYVKSSPERYQSLYSSLKKIFGPPETGRTDSSVNHTFTGEGTTVQLTADQGAAGKMTIHLSFYPSNIFSRFLTL